VCNSKLLWVGHGDSGSLSLWWLLPAEPGVLRCGGVTLIACGSRLTLQHTWSAHCLWQKYFLVPLSALSLRQSALQKSAAYCCWGICCWRPYMVLVLTLFSHCLVLMCALGWAVSRNSIQDRPSPGSKALTSVQYRASRYCDGSSCVYSKCLRVACSLLMPPGMCSCRWAGCGLAGPCSCIVVRVQALVCMHHRLQYVCAEHKG
jgi:hypothetical protein